MILNWWSNNSPKPKLFYRQICNKDILSKGNYVVETFFLIWISTITAGTATFSKLKNYKNDHNDAVISKVQVFLRSDPVQIIITWLWHEFCVLWMFWFGSLNSFLVKQGVNEINIIYNTVGEKDQSKIIVWITIKLYYENSYDFS